MSYSVNSVHLLTISSSLWLGAGGNGKGMWYDSQPQGKAMKNIFVTLFKSADPVITSHLKTDVTPDSPPLRPAPARPTLARASTSVTLIDTDFVSAALSPVVSHRVAEVRRTPSLDNLQSTELIDRLRNCLPCTPKPPVEDGNLDQDAPAVDVVTPPPKVRRGKKRATKKTVRWSPEVIEREIQANRPVTGFERLERFRRLGLTV